jgi:hypothetical protein
MKVIVTVAINNLPNFLIRIQVSHKLLPSYFRIIKDNY